MATLDDVRRIALSLPGVTEEADTFKFVVDGRQFAWRWLERVHPKQARVPSIEVIAVRIANEFDKDPLIAMSPAVFFTEAHYDGYAAILVRLAAIDEDLLTVVLTDGWRAKAPKRLLGNAPPRP